MPVNRPNQTVATAGDRETIRCFVQIVNDVDSQELAHRIGASVNGWSFETFTQQIAIESQSAESLSIAVEHAQQALKLYPESMQLIVGSNVLDGNRLREPLGAARSEFQRGHLAVVQLGSTSAEPAAALDGVIRSDNLRSEIRRVVRMLHYQRPVSPKEPPCAPVMRVIQDRKDFTAALRVRFMVYELMGYIPERYRSTKTGLELDYLDKYSLHYVCQLPGETRELPGAALRLITRKRQRNSKRWIDQTLKEYPDEALRRSARTAQFQELPVFNAIQSLDEFQALLQTEDAEYCELSRVVVNEACRGMGLSRGLIEFALADARQRGIRCVFLACVPEQVSMYEKYGFLNFPSDIVTFARVQQPAQAMFQFL